MNSPQSGRKSLGEISPVLRDYKCSEIVWLSGVCICVAVYLLYLGLKVCNVRGVRRYQVTIHGGLYIPQLGLAFLWVAGWGWWDGVVSDGWGGWN